MYMESGCVRLDALNSPVVQLGANFSIYLTETDLVHRYCGKC
jgi:hypothetical protein